MDTNNQVHPDAEEVCNGLDDDCDPATDELGDADGDGHSLCEGDCADDEPTVHPGAEELCDGYDTDCDGVLDNNEADLDGDGWLACGGDCDDTDPDTYPGAPEQCNGEDDDCNPATSEHDDLDGDGFTPCNGDCDDTEQAVHPDVATDPCDGVDDDCDGDVDEDHEAGWILVAASGGDTWEIDPTTAQMTRLSNLDLNLCSLDVWQSDLSVGSTAEEIVTVSVCDGSTSTVGSLGGAWVCGITFDGGGHLFGLDAGADRLIAIDPSNATIAPIGGLGIALGPHGLAYDCGTETMYGIDAYQDRLFKVDPATGQAYGLIPLGIPFEVVGLEFDHRERSLLASNGDALFRIDPTTGTYDVVGTLNGTVDNLAFHPACP